MFNINGWCYQGGTGLEDTSSVGQLALPAGNSILILMQYYGMPLVQKKCKLERHRLLSVIRRFLLITSTRDDFGSERWELSRFPMMNLWEWLVQSESQLLVLRLIIFYHLCINKKKKRKDLRFFVCSRKNALSPLKLFESNEQWL